MNRLSVQAVVVAVSILFGCGCKQTAPGNQTNCESRAQAFEQWGQKLLAGKVDRPVSEIDKDIDAILQMGDEDRRFGRLTAVLFFVFKDCYSQVVQNLRPLETAMGEDKPRLIVEGISKSLRDCSCKVDLPSARAVVYAIIKEPKPKESVVATQCSKKGMRVVESTDGVKLCAVDCGGKPAENHLLVVCGGPGVSHHPCKGLCRFDSPKLQVTTYDQRATGDSTSPKPANYSIEAHTQDIDKVRESIGAEKIHILGCSWGGILSMAYAQRYPDHVESLILVGSGPPSPEEMERVGQRIQRRIQRLQKEGIIPDPLPSPHDAVEYVVAIAPAYPSNPRFTLPKDFLELKADPVNDVKNWEAFKEYNLHKRLKGLPVRILIIQGEDDPTGMEAVEDIKSALAPTKPEVHVLKKCGHMPWEERRDEFTRILGNWLK